MLFTVARRAIHAQDTTSASLQDVKYVLQVFRAVVFLAMIGVAFIPVLSLADLTGGGTGLGLCSSGLAWCDNSYFVGPEILAALVAVLAGLLALFHYAGKGIWWIERRQQDDLRRRGLL